MQETPKFMDSMRRMIQNAKSYSKHRDDSDCHRAYKSSLLGWARELVQTLQLRRGAYDLYYDSVRMAIVMQTPACWLDVCMTAVTEPLLDNAKGIEYGTCLSRTDFSKSNARWFSLQRDLNLFLPELGTVYGSHLLPSQEVQCRSPGNH